MEPSPEYKKQSLEIELSGITLEDLKKPGTTVAFSVPPTHTIYISGESHADLSKKYNFKLDETLTEGYIKVDDNGKIEVMFKNDNYQKISGFKGSQQDYFLLKESIKEKILDLLSFS